jgi:flagellar biosynthesis/type III secretory pathway protein FliH
MSNNIQLPADVLDELEAAAQDKYTKMAENAEDIKDDAYAQGYAEGWHTGATEYATKLHQAEQENTDLKRWKAEANELLNPILNYGQSKEAAIPIGASITKTVLERCKHVDAARTLLEKFISRHEGGLLPDRFIYNEIKTFLDGTK